MAEVKNICLEALERHCASGSTGRLDFFRGDFNGQIYTKDSLLIHAHLAGLEGVPALFRLFDWGDAETTWQPGVLPDSETLHLTMDAASELYAENLQERAEIDTRDKSRLEALLAPEVVATQGLSGVESILKAYTIVLDCNDHAVMPDPFVFADPNKSSYVIGSSQECDVILVHSSIDPLHCGMILERGSVMVWDLGGTSGVKINGTPVAQDVLTVGDIMTLGALELRVRFQLRRPTLKPKVPAPGAPGAAAKPLAPPTTPQPNSTTPMPKVAPSKEIPKGAITYEKVARQLRGRGAGIPFLEKLASMFGGKKDK